MRSDARLAYDSASYARILANDFYGVLREQRLSRDDFMKLVARRNPASVLVVFTNPILTISNVAGQDEWIAVVLERLEYELKSPDGSVARQAQQLIKRDRFRRVGTEWKLAYTEELGREVWPPGVKPPFADWP